MDVYASPAGSDGWRAVAGHTGVHASLVISGQTGYATASQDGHRPVLLAGPASGTAPWQARPLPCRQQERGNGVLPPAAAGRGLALGCGGQPGPGNQIKTLAISDDGG